MRRLRYLAAVCALGALSCQSQDRTRLAVTVYSDLSIPTDIDTLVLDVKGPTDTRHVEYQLTVQPVKGKFTLPIQTILVPQGGNNDAFTVTATGTVAVAGTMERSTVVTRSARLSFLSGQARELSLFLTRDCYKKTCAGETQTCVAGACVDNTVAIANLPVYTTNLVGTAKMPDASPFTNTSLDGGPSSLDAVAPGDGLGDTQRIASDASGDLVRLETGESSDTQGLPADGAPDVPVLPPTDTLPPPPSDGGTTLAPDTALPTNTLDTRAATVDGAAVPDSATPTDTVVLLDTRPPALDTSTPDAPTLPPDAAVDAPCPTACTVGAKRCGASGVQTCALLPNGCTAFGPDVACGQHQACTGTEPSAACTCLPSGSPTCPLAVNPPTGTFCDDSGVLQACQKDSDGCYYLGTAVTCPTGKPCSGSPGSASCSCGPVPAPCTTTVGTFCNSANQVVSCAYSSETGCMVATPTTTCPAGKPCAQTGPSAAECTCPAVVECDTAGEMNRSYCATGNTVVVTCAADGNACQSVSKTTCSGQRTCQASGTTASCECINTSCRDSNNATFSNQTCDGEATVLTCGSVDSCPSVASATCGTGTVCRASGGTASCLTTAGWYTELTGSVVKTPGALAGHPVTLTAPATLKSFGIVSRGSANVVVGLYTDGNVLVASSASTGRAITAGRNDIPVATPTSPVTLTAGKYWIMAVYQAQVSVAGTPAPPYVAHRSVDFIFGNVLPSTLTGVDPTTTAQANYYLLISPQ